MMRRLSILCALLLLLVATRAHAKKLDLRSSELFLRTVAGQATKLAPYAGSKLTLVNLWATWCGPCREEMPALEGLHKKYKAQGFAIVGVSMDEDDDAGVKTFLAKKKLAYPVVLSTVKKTDTALGGVDALPTSILLDETGDVLEVIVGAVDLPEMEKSIQGYLKGKAPAKKK
jgi:thiol-disulfide isomerase/thioredoxin